MKVAVIGRGFGAYAMAPAFEAHGFDVELVPSRDPAAIARALAGPVDLVSIHSPPFQHREHVMAALAAGRDVLCDKPFGRNAAEAREMRDAARAAGVLHFLNFEFRHHPARMKVTELVRGGAIGNVLHVSCGSFANYMHGRKHGWLCEADKGGGWIGAYGSHIIDALRWHLDSEIRQCGGTTRIDEPRRMTDDGTEALGTAEDAFSAWFTMANGATAAIDAAFSLPVAVPARTQLLGSAGIVELRDENVVTVFRPGDEPEVFDFSPKPGDPAWPAVYGWIGAIKESLVKRRQIAPSFDDGVAAAEVMDRLKAASLRVG